MFARMYNRWYHAALKSVSVVSDNAYLDTTFPVEAIELSSDKVHNNTRKLSRKAHLSGCKVWMYRTAKFQNILRGQVPGKSVLVLRLFRTVTLSFVLSVWSFSIKILGLESLPFLAELTNGRADCAHRRGNNSLFANVTLRASFRCHP